MSEIRQLRGADAPMDFNIEAEQQVLGTVMIDPPKIDLIADILKAENFCDPLHGKIWRICVDRHLKSHLVSPVAMAAVLQDDPDLSQVGGGKYLIRMAGTAMPSGILDYARLVVEMSCRRALRQAGEDCLRSITAGADSPEIKAALLQALYGLPEVDGQETTVSMLKAVSKAAGEAVLAYQGQQNFLKTGVDALDKIIRGLGPTDYMLLGGATSMGKTSMALEIARNVAERGQGVTFVSLEMAQEELATRLVSAKSRIPYSDLRSAADMSEGDFRKWIEATSSVADLPIRIVPKNVRDVAGVHAATKKASLEFKDVPLKLLVVDYVQLLRAPGMNTTEQMRNVSVSVKALTSILGVPVIALCQLSREIGKRDDKRPQLSDIKESGQFENDADQVVFCHRPDYWLKREGPKPDARGRITVEAEADYAAEMQRSANKMQLIVRKNRHGPLGTAEVGFHDATNRFWPLSDHDLREGEF